MRIDDTVSKDDKTNYETKFFQVIEIFGYNGTAVVNTLRAIELDIFTLYDLNIPIPVEKRLGLFLRVLKGTTKPRFEEAIREC